MLHTDILNVEFVIDAQIEQL